VIVIGLGLAAVLVAVGLALLFALMASTRPSAQSTALVPVRPAERTTARRERIVERFDRWGRPMRITEREVLDLPARSIEL
jgi:hypothetical protein